MAPLASRISAVLKKCKSKLTGRRKEMSGLRSQRDFLARSLRDAELDFIADEIRRAGAHLRRRQLTRMRVAGRAVQEVRVPIVIWGDEEEEES